MAKDERRQQDEIKQILYSDSPQVQPVGRPRSRGVNRPPQQENLFSPEPPRQNVQQAAQNPQNGRQLRPMPQGQRSKVRSFEKAPYASGQSRSSPRPVAESSSGAVTWLLLLLVLVLMAVAVFLVYTLLNGGFGGGALGGTQNTARLAPPKEALLPQTQDAGQEYINQSIFIGDSNFERLREYGMVEASTVAAKQGIGIASVVNDAFMEVTGQTSPLTISQTMAAVRPRRILIMLGTNDVPNMAPEDFAALCKDVLKDLKKSAPSSDIVVAAIPPVANWKDSEMLNSSAVRQFNQVLLEVCKKEGFAYLDSYAALADDGGYLPEAYTDDGYHLTQAALQKLLEYYRTHAYNP